VTEDSSGNAGIGGRLVSLDVFRGITMFLLIAEPLGILDLLAAPGLQGTAFHALGLQFQHHPWNGLRFWDLGQPFFMFISGVAMFFSYNARWERGTSWRETLIHALKRSFLLFFLGWAIYRIVPVEDNPHGAFLYDVLPHLALASLVAFLMMKRSVQRQLMLAFGLLLMTDLLFRLWPVPGFNQPFVPGRNFGSYVDRLIMGAPSANHWVAFNMVPSVAFVIWGVLAGRLLRGPGSPSRKIRTLALWGCGGVAAGLALSPIVPIIGRICTSSFVLVSGGLGLLALALSYLIVDVMRLRRWTMLPVVVGMNPLFIYLFSQTGGGDWLRRIAAPFSEGIFGWAGEWPAQLATSLAAWGLLWAICYWLYRRKIFIKI
jgi:predicted acyltransferase